MPTAEKLHAPSGTPGSSGVDSYTCYTVAVPRNAPKFSPIRNVMLDDQFTPGPRVFDIMKPSHLCVAADENGHGIKNADANLMCYQAKPSRRACTLGAPAQPGLECVKEEDCGGHTRQTKFCMLQPAFKMVPGAFVDNEFGPEDLDLTRETELCVPSQLP